MCLEPLVFVRHDLYDRFMLHFMFCGDTLEVNPISELVRLQNFALHTFSYTLTEVHTHSYIVSSKCAV